jgi:photosystem II stability/assembly factor-like uncharacterized protein
MRSVTVLSCITLFASVCSSQWTLNSGFGSRKDDVFFLGADTGWAAGGLDGSIFRTYTGGPPWQTVYTGPDYLRSIEFATPQVGFCGTLSNTFLRTTDGGDTWEDIASLIPAPSSICGLCAVNAQVIYGVGVWFTPAYVIRSINGGESWSKTDLSSVASAMVDVYFLNADTGFISGRAMPPTMDGLILATVDGGNTWTERHRTGTTGDYVWKLQSPDNGQHIYGSMDAVPGTPTRFLRSADRGITWVTDTISADYTYIQAIGFLDTLHGWMGAEYTLLETTDGGDTWNMDLTPPGGGYDRFHRVSNTLAYLSGDAVYKYGDVSTVVPASSAKRDSERVEVTPNPATDEASVRVHVLGRSEVEVVLLGADGRRVRTVYMGRVAAGEQTFPLSLADLASGSYYITLRTNQGLTYGAFVKR